MNNTKKEDFQILFLKAKNLINSRNFLKAIEILKSILFYKPNFTPALNNIAYCYFQLNKFDDSEKYYLLCSKKEPLNTQILNNLALLYSKKKYLHKALLVLQKSLEINLEQLNVVEKIGYCLIELNKYSEANVICKKFLKKYPTNNFLTSYYEKSFFKLGKNIEGLKFLQKKTGFIQFDDDKVKII